MEIEQVAELARAVAALPQAEKDFFDGLVADERAKAADAERIAKLRSMSDKEAVSTAVNAGVKLMHRAHRPGNVVMDVDLDEVARVLREAGFVRHQADQPKVDLPEAITRVTEVIREIDFLVSKGHSVANAPSLRHWLLRGLDALTGENHSGLEPSLPQPKRKLV